MGRKISLLKVIISCIALGVFGWYEYHLILKYLQEDKVRKEILEKNTKNIEKSFFIREKSFYLNSKYLKGFEEIKIKEQQNANVGGEEALEQLEQQQFEQSEEL